MTEGATAGVRTYTFACDNLPRQPPQEEAQQGQREQQGSSQEAEPSAEEGLSEQQQGGALGLGLGLAGTQQTEEGSGAAAGLESGAAATLEEQAPAAEGGSSSATADGAAGEAGGVAACGGEAAPGQPRVVVHLRPNVPLPPQRIYALLAEPTGPPGEPAAPQDGPPTGARRGGRPRRRRCAALQHPGPPHSPAAPPTRRPAGGRLELLVRADGILDGSQADGSQWLDVHVSGRGLHAPLVERALELPMDIYAGRVGGLVVGVVVAGWWWWCVCVGRGLGLWYCAAGLRWLAALLAWEARQLAGPTPSPAVGCLLLLTHRPPARAPRLPPRVRRWRAACACRRTMPPPGPSPQSPAASPSRVSLCRGVGVQGGAPGLVPTLRSRQTAT